MKELPTSGAVSEGEYATTPFDNFFLYKNRPFDKGFFDALYSLSSFYWEDVAPFSAPAFPPSFYFVICTGKS